MNKVRFDNYNNFDNDKACLEVYYLGYKKEFEELLIIIDKDGRIVSNGWLRGDLDLNYYIAIGKVCEVVKQLDGSDLLKEAHSILSKLNRKLHKELGNLYDENSFKYINVKNVFSSLEDLKSKRRRLKREDRIILIDEEIKVKEAELIGAIKERDIIDKEAYKIKGDMMNVSNKYFDSFNNRLSLMFTKFK